MSKRTTIVLPQAGGSYIRAKSGALTRIPEEAPAEAVGTFSSPISDETAETQADQPVKEA